MEGKMNEKRKKSDGPELDLCLKTPVEDESINKIPTLNEAIKFELGHGNIGPNVDPKKFRRTISNRLSAQRARLKISGYMTELEQKFKDLRNTIALVTQQIETVKGEQKMLQLENELLQRQLDIVTEKSNLCTAQTEEMKLELKGLKELAKAKEEEQTRVKEQSTNSNNYESEPEEEIDVDHYLNFDAINFYPPKNDM
ncbi:hypothetical protein HAX54_016634 [Datura stramonium]|uniref:BZIP domain-containing protein n=1 Tax=Datura stramonium TaxID=4076 RepID=A0ABS8ULH4_DATST|nr:hypothetical protein [Datura stramonium]